MNEKLTEQIEKIIQDRTLSLEAIESVNSLKENRDSLQEQLDAKESECNSIKAKYDNLVIEKRAVDAEVKKLREQSLAVDSLSELLHKKEIEQSADKASALAYKYALDVVFKPTSIRKRLLRDALAASSSYASDGTSHVGEHPVVEEIVLEE